MKLRDDDGELVGHGDSIEFRYGIPPVKVIAAVVRCGKSLVAITSEHNPTSCNLRSLRKYVGEWYKVRQ